MVELSILGPMEARQGGRPIALGGAKQRAVLALLALNAGKLVPRDTLIEQVWGPEPPPTAGHALQVQVSSLRKLLGADAVATREGGYMLDLNSEGVIDVQRFERLAAEGRSALLAERHDEAAQKLGEALDLWRGPPLADFLYEPFAQAAIARLEEQRLAAVEDRIEAELELGRHDALIPELETLVGEHPLRERPRGQLMLALYRSGRQADALACYREGRALLVEELGIEPHPPLRELEAAILRHDPSLMVEPPELRERRHLPAPATSLIGRGAEIAQARLLVAGGARLLTLTGPGGVGKTRLAIHLAASLAERFPDGVWFAGLASIRDPRLVEDTVAQALEAGEPLAEHLAARRLLLVIDNFEQVDEAAPLVAELLERAAGLTVLVTSRSRLQLYGEHELPVPPLPEDEAAALFEARVAAARPGFEVTAGNAAQVAEIVSRLDGLPLALELVAGRVRDLSLSELLDGLERRLELAGAGPRNVPERQQTLRAAIGWSYDLLGEHERSMFRRAGVFAGGFDAEAAAAVAGASRAELAALVERSLLRRVGGPRFSMLETIREYALERLEESGEADAARLAHARHFVQLAERSEQELKGPDQARWAVLMEGEHDNMRAALGWLLADAPRDTEQRDLALRFAASLGWFWYVHSHAAEGCRWLELALEHSEGAPALLRGRCLHCLGILRDSTGRSDLAAELFEQGLAIFRELGEEQRVASAMNSLAITARNLGDFDRARELFTEAADRHRRTGDIQRLPDPLANLAQVELDSGDLARARELFEESLALCREQDNAWRVAQDTVSLGGVSLAEGDVAGARKSLDEGIRGLHEHGDNSYLMLALEYAAGVAAAEEQYDRAGRLAGAADALRAKLEEPRSPPEVAALDRYLAPAREALGEAGLRRAVSEGERLSPEETLDYVLSWKP